MAAVWKAPVVFVCENNQYMEYTPIGDVTAVAAACRGPGEPPTASSRSSSTATTSTRSTGSPATAIDRARAGDGPSLIEALTYRHGGHSRADPGKYRPDDEVAAWKARDPIPAYRARLLEARRGRRRPRRDRRRDPRRRRRGRGDRRDAPEPTPEPRAPDVAGDRRSGPMDRGRLGARERIMAELTYRAAIAAGIAQEMERDESVVLIGEDVGAAGGVFKLTEGLFDGSGRTASATRRSASRPSSVRRWARR